MERPIFSKAAIARLILPLIVEQFLAVTVGMADTLMVAVDGELAVSGISLVDTLNILLINVFTALATGGAVVASHYLGEGKQEKACDACNQLMLVVFSLSAVIALLSVGLNPQIIGGIYGNLDPQVFSYARTYYYLTACSFPFLAVYNGAAAICRSMGNSGISMKVSILMNGMNIVGNAILIYGFRMSVAGAGTSTLVSRITAAVIMVCLVRNQKLELHIDRNLRLGFIPEMIGRILRVGVPVGIENGLFQGGKLMVAGLISSFGTSAIAANAVGNTIASYQTIPGTAIGLALITIVGQAVGAHRYREAKRYTVGLCLTATAAHILLCVPMLLNLRTLISFYNVSPETMDLAWRIGMLHGTCAMLIWPMSFVIPNALRAADDAKFAMSVTVMSMFLCRVAMSWVLGKYMGLGLFGVWLAMILDWVVRSVIYVWRFASGRWLKHHLAHVEHLQMQS